jgi:hypothetical protein
VLDELKDAALGDRGLALGERPSEERIVDGSQLRALCLELDAAGARFLSLSGAHVTGQLELAGTALKLALFFEDCTFDEPILLVSTRVARLVLEQCTVPALVASRLTVEAELELPQTTVRGESTLMLSRLGGFLGDRAVLGSDAAGSALHLDGAQVEGAISLTEAVATGVVSLRGARVGGDVNAQRAHIDAGGGNACALDRAQIGGDVYMSDGFTCAGGVRGLDTRIAGSLCLDDATFESPWAAVFDRASIGGDLTLRRLACRGRVSFDGTHVGRAVFGDGAVLESDAEYSLSFRRAEIGDMVYLGDGFQGGGPLLVSYARIGGDLNCVDATLKCHVEADALTAVGTEIGGSVVLTNLSAVGRVFFMNSQIGGGFSAIEANIANLPDPAVDLVSVRVESAIVLDGLQSKGPVQIRGTRVGADVAVNGASLAAPGRPSALYIVQTEIEGALTLSDVQADGIGVLVSRAAILDDDLGGTGRELGSWTPTDGVLRLDGFRYDGFRRTVPVGARVRWLLATETYEPRSWLQLASTLRAQGRDSDATRVLVEMQNDRLRRGGLSRPGWLGHQILRVTIGHGYRSWLAGVWAMVVIALFALVVWRAPGNFDADPGVHGAPQPVAYAADTFLPIVDLGEASRWLATGWVAWVDWGVILVGWALTTIFVAGFTRVVRSE